MPVFLPNSSNRSFVDSVGGPDELVFIHPDYPFQSILSDFSLLNPEIILAGSSGWVVFILAKHTVRCFTTGTRRRASF